MKRTRAKELQILKARLEGMQLMEKYYRQEGNKERADAYARENLILYEVICLLDNKDCYDKMADIWLGGE